MVRTGVVLRLGSAEEVLGTRLKTEPRLDRRFCPLHSIFPVAELQRNDSAFLPNHSIVQQRRSIDSTPNAYVQKKLAKPLCSHVREGTFYHHRTTYRAISLYHR